MDKNRDFTTNFDHMLPTFADDLTQITADLRAGCPFAHSAEHDGFWILSRYEDVMEVIRDEKRFCSKKGTAIPEVERQMQALPVESDPPDHTKYRSFLIPWLAAQKVNTYAPAIRRFVTELINSFIEQGTCDLIASLAVLLPALVTPMIMGIDRKEWPLFIKYMKQIIETAETNDEEENIKIRQSFLHYMLREMERRKRKPRDDFFTSLVITLYDGQPLSGEEVVCLVLTILTAGLETTTNALSNLLLALCEYPDVRQQLLNDPRDIPLFIEETLRYYAPLQYVGRKATCEMTMHEQKLALDEKVLLLLGSANHDQRAFSHADQFIFNRQLNRHLAFGHGIHFCVGAHLARLQMRIVTEEVLRRLPDYQLCQPVKRRFSVGQVYGVETLPVVFTPGKVEALPSEMETSV